MGLHINSEAAELTRALVIQSTRGFSSPHCKYRSTKRFTRGAILRARWWNETSGHRDYPPRQRTLSSDFYLQRGSCEEKKRDSRSAELDHEVCLSSYLSVQLFCILCSCFILSSRQLHTAATFHSDGIAWGKSELGTVPTAKLWGESSASLYNEEKVERH